MLRPDLVGGLQPDDIAAYLQARGWQKGEGSELLDTWYVEKDGEILGHIAVPLRPEMPDYRSLVALALERVAEASDTRSLEVIEDVRAINFDTVRIRLQGRDHERGRIALVRAPELIDGVKTLFFAGAAGVEKYQAAYHARSTRRVESYVNALEIAPPEKGSFVVKVLSPIPSRLDQFAALDAAVGDEPFSRVATATVLKSLAATIDAAKEAQTHGVSVFKDHVENGVNANLCEALTELTLGHASNAVTISASWSSRRPAPTNILQKVFVPPELMPVIERAAPVLRGKNPDDPVEVVGLVHLLKEDKDAGSRAVGLTNSKPEWPRRVRVKLSAGQYSRAIAAHGADSLVRVLGVVRRRGSFSYIDDPLEFEVFDADSRQVGSAAAKKRTGLRAFLDDEDDYSPPA